MTKHRGHISGEQPLHPDEHTRPSPKKPPESRTGGAPGARIFIMGLGVAEGNHNGNKVRWKEGVGRNGGRGTEDTSMMNLKIPLLGDAWHRKHYSRMGYDI